MEIKSFSIPELDASQPLTQKWTAHEIYILERYYGKVPGRKMVAHLPGRTLKAIQNKAYQLGLTGE